MYYAGTSDLTMFCCWMQVLYSGVPCLRDLQQSAAVEQAEVIIDHGVQSFMHWLDQRRPQAGVVPLIRQLEHFAAVIEGRAIPVITGREGRQTLAATLRIEAVTSTPGTAP